MFRSSGGFTLIEFLVSLVILMVGLLGLLQAVNVSYSHSLQNQLRNEAIMVADQEMSKELAKGFDGVDAGAASGGAPVMRNYSVSRRMMNAFKMYSVASTRTWIQNSKQITIDVRWKYKGNRYSHNASGALTKTNQ